MATKKKVNLNDTGTTSWGKALRDDYLKAQERGKAIIDAAEADGIQLTDTQKNDLIWQLATTGEFDLTQASPEGEVTAPDTSVTPQEDTGFWGSRVAGLQQDLGEISGVVDALQAGGARDLGAVIEQTGRLYTGPTREQLAERGITSPILEGLNSVTDFLSNTAAENMRASNEVLQPIVERGGIEGLLARTAQDAASSGVSSAASIVGGPYAAAVAGGVTYANEFQAAKDAGLSDEAANTHAIGQGVLEGALSFVPAEKWIEKIPVLGPAVRSAARRGAGALEERLLNPSLRAAAKTTATMAGEGFEEGATTVAQSLAAAAMAGAATSEQNKAFYEQQADLANLGENVERSVLAGAAMGGVTAPANVVSAKRSFEADAQERADRLSDEVIRTGNEALTRDRARTQPITTPRQSQAPAPVQSELFPETTPGPTSEVPEDTGPAPQPGDAAIDDPEVSQQRREVLRSLRDRELAKIQDLEAQADNEVFLRESGYGDLADQNIAELEQSRGRVEVLDREIAKWEGGAANQPALPLGERAQPKPRSPKPVQTRGGDTVYNPDGTVSSNRRDAAVKDAQKALAEQRTADQKEITAEFNRQQKARTDARNIERTRLAEESRNLPEAERAGFIADGMQTWEAANPAIDKSTITLEAARAAAAQPKGRRATKTAAPRQAAPTTPAPVPGAVTDSKTINDLSSKLGLGMAADQKTQGRQFDQKAYENKVRRSLRALSRSNTQDDVDVMNLAKQGKLVFVPDAPSVGLEEAGHAAAYVPEDGRMYVYTNNLKPEDVGGQVIRAVHESVHGLNRNDREGRNELLRNVVGSDRLASSAGKVRTAARSGNRIAQAAVRAATADTANRGGDNQFENEEIMAYLAGEVKKARQGSSLGALRGVVGDLNTAVRSWVRDNTNMNVNVSFGDLASASQGALGEAVRTDLAPSEGSEVGMVGNRQATGFSQAQQQARDFVDEMGNIKFLFSDADSSLNEDGVAELRNLSDGETIDLDRVLNHPELYRQYPDARNIQVGIGRGLTSAGAYLPAFKEIQIRPSVFNRSSAVDLRGLILHETQHWVQDVGGESGIFHGEALSDRNLTPQQQRDVQRYRDALAENEHQTSRVMNNVDVFRRELPSRTQQVVIDSILASDEVPAIKARNLAQMAEDSGDLSPHLRRIVDNYAKSLDEYREAVPVFNQISQDAFDRYVENQTEAEAFFTQANRDVRAEDLPRNPRSDPRYGTRRMQADAMGRRGALGMAEETGGRQQTFTARYAPTWVNNLLFADRGLTREDNAKIEQAMASPAGMLMKSEAAMGRYEYELDQEAARQGTTAAQLNKQIEQELEAIPKDLESYEENVAAFNAVVNKYGAAGDALKDLRDQVDNLTLTMVQQRAEMNTPLTDKEKKLYNTLLANLGRYTHRQYAAHAGKLGHKYSKSVWDDYNKRKASGNASEEQAVEDNYQKVARAVDRLVDSSLMIPDDETMGNMGADQTRRLYGTWIDATRVEAVPLDLMKDRLAEIRDQVNGNSDEMTKKAEQIVKELLNLAENKSPITTYYRGGKLDRGILQKRQYIPSEIRNLMGEITDPSMRLVMTVAKQAEFVAKNKMLMNLANSGSPDIADPNAATPDDWVRLTGEGYGPLENYQVSPLMFSAIGDVQQQLATFEQAIAMAATSPKELGVQGLQKISDGWSWLAGRSKLLQIMGNPMNFLYNLGGGPMIMMTNGNVNPKYIKNAFLDARDLVIYAVNPKKASENATRLVSNDIVDSAFIGEIKNDKYKAFKDLVDEMSGHPPKQIVSTLSTWFGKGTAFGKEMYAMMDVMFKIANFHQQVDVLTDFYKKEGIERTPEDIDLEAADNVKRTNFTYRRVAPLLKAMEQRGFTAFGPYMHEVFRTQITNVLQGRAEFQRALSAATPEGRNVMLLQSIRRLGGQALMWGLTGYMSHMLGVMAFGEDDDEARKKRSVLAEWARDQDFYQVGEDKNGYPVFFNVSRFDPAGPATDVMRSMMHGEATPETLGRKLLDVYVIPRLVPQAISAVGSTFGDERPTREPTFKQLAPEAYSTLADAARAVGIDPNTTIAWTNFFEAMMPGITTSWRDTNARPVPKDGDSAAAAMASYGGLQLMSTDPARAIQFAAMDYSSAVKDARKNLDQFYDLNPNRSYEETLAEVLDQRENEHTAWQEARDVYEGAIAVQKDREGDKKLSQRQILAMFKNERLREDQLRAIRTGQFKSTIIDQQSIDTYRDNELKDTSDRAEKREIKQKWKDISRTLRQVQKEVKKEDRQ